MVLNCPPEEWPNSGENWFCSTENSATASLGTVTRVPVTLVSLLSTPSIVKLLFSRTLAADRRPASHPHATARCNPESSRERFRTPLPMVAEGKSSTCCEVKSLVTRAVVVSKRLRGAGNLDGVGYAFYLKSNGQGDGLVQLNSESVNGCGGEVRSRSRNVVSPYGQVGEAVFAGVIAFRRVLDAGFDVHRLDRGALNRRARLIEHRPHQVSADNLRVSLPNQNATKDENH